MLKPSISYDLPLPVDWRIAALVPSGKSALMLSSGQIYPILVRESELSDGRVGH